MARSRGKKPRPPAAKKPESKFKLAQFVDWGSLGWSLIPSSFLTAVFYVFQELEAWKATLIGLVCLAVTAVIIKTLSARAAGISILLFLIMVSILSYRQYHSYKLDFQYATLGFAFLPTDQNSIAAAGVELVFKNNNDFDIWIKSNRRISSINSLTNTINTDMPAHRMMSGSVDGIRDDLIVFSPPIQPKQITEGTFDFNICYGRMENELDNGLTISGTFTTQFDAYGALSLAIDEEVRKYGACGS